MLFYCICFLFYRMKLMCFAYHLSSFLLIFCPFNFIFPLVPIVSFCSYIILIMSKKWILSINLLFLKGNSKAKLFSFFEFYFVVSKQKFSPTHPGYQILKNFPTPSLFQLLHLLTFEEFSTPLQLFQPPPFHPHSFC